MMNNDQTYCPKCGGTKTSPAPVCAAVIYGAAMNGDRLTAEWANPVAVYCCHKTHDKPGFDRLAFHPNR